MLKTPVLAMLIVFAGFTLFALLQPGLAPGQSPDEVNARLASVPLNIGNWTGTDNQRTDKDSKDMRIAGALASISRRYRDEKGNEISLLVLYGKPAYMGAHSPQVCYGAIGFRECAQQSQKEFGRNNQLWFLRFENERSNRETLAVYWGWGINGDWQAPENPRTTFSDQAAIYKVYIQRGTGEAKSDEEDPILRQFAVDFLTVLSDKIVKPNS